MKKLFCVIAAATILVLIGAKEQTGGVKEPQCAAIEKAVLQTHEKIVKAAEAMDLETFYDFILDHDKGVIINDGRLFATRQEALESSKKAFEGIRHIEYQFDKKLVHVLSPEIAVVATSGTTFVETDSGQSFQRPFAHTSVFVLQDGQWKITHGHHSVPDLR